MFKVAAKFATPPEFSYRAAELPCTRRFYCAMKAQGQKDCRRWASSLGISSKKQWAGVTPPDLTMPGLWQPSRLIRDIRL